MKEKFQSNCNHSGFEKNQGIKSVRKAKRVTVAAAIDSTSVTIMCGAN